MTTTAIKHRSLDRIVPIQSPLARLLEVSKLWHARARQRRHLAELTPSQLSDAGITRADAFIEARKPFWRG
jgi:uncharacterized protein YjiS (DUF1127 family)